MKKQLMRLGFGLAAFALFMCSAYADMPKTINLQSVVYDPDGNITTASSVAVTVRIVDEAGNVFFQEDNNDVPVVKGAMNLIIGESSGGIPSDAVDPTTTRKFVDVLVNGSNPYDILPLSAVPYALWADKAITVVKDGVTAESIKDGAIEPRHLSKGFDISNVAGVVTDSQIPANIVRQDTFNLHTSSTAAHAASAITNTAFPTQLGATVQIALETLYNDYAQEVANRQSSITNLNTQMTNSINNLQSQINTNSSNISSLSGTVSSDGTRITNLEGNVSSLAGTAAGHETRIQALEGKDIRAEALGWGVVDASGNKLFGYNFASSSRGVGIGQPTIVYFESVAADDNVVVVLTPMHASLGSTATPHVESANRNGFDVSYTVSTDTVTAFHWIAFANH